MSQFQFSKKIAFRYLWSRRSEAFITIISIISILGVALGVMVLNIVMAVMTGFEFELRSKILGANSHITVRSFTSRISDWRDAKVKIQHVGGVESVSAYTYNQALLRTHSSATGILIRGIERESAAAKQVQTYLDSHLSIQTALNPGSVQVTDENGEESEATLPPLIIGGELSHSTGLYSGTPVSLFSPTVSSSPFGLVPRFRRFVVSGIYRSGLVEYESGLAYTDLESAQKFFQLGDAVSGIEVRVNNVDIAPKIGADILEALGGVKSGYYVQDWTESNKPLWEALRLEKKVYFIVLLLIILMASFSIVTTLIMIVLEKRKDIAVMRTMGATSRAIGTIFVIQGTTIGALGVILGIVLGYIGCVLLQTYGFPLNEKVFQMSTLPIKVEFLNFALVGICAFIICSVATIYPASRASKLKEAELLRSE